MRINCRSIWRIRNLKEKVTSSCADFKFGYFISLSRREGQTNRSRGKKSCGAWSTRRNHCFSHMQIITSWFFCREVPGLVGSIV